MRAHRLVHIRRYIPSELQKFMGRTHLTVAVHFIFDRSTLEFRFHRCFWPVSFALMTGRFMCRYTLSRRCRKIASSTLKTATFIVPMMLHIPLHIGFVNGFEVAKFAHHKVHCVIASMALKSITYVVCVVALIAIVYFHGLMFATNVFDHR